MSNSNENQYKSSRNLEIRGFLHKKYSIGSESWMTWLFKQYSFPLGAKILEFGCGTAYLWKENEKLISNTWEILLTDLSAGMLETAKTNIGKNYNENIQYMVCNIEDTHSIKGEYDNIIANHMLYHVPNLDKALNNVHKLLKAKGLFYASTTSKNNFKEMTSIISGFTGNNKARDLNKVIVDKFSLDNGMEILKKYFSNTEIRKQSDGLKITDAKPFAEYILSLNNVVDGIIIAQPEEIEELSRYCQKIIDTVGYIYISKEAGTFICRS